MYRQTDRQVEIPSVIIISFVTHPSPFHYNIPFLLSLHHPVQFKQDNFIKLNPL